MPLFLCCERSRYARGRLAATSGISEIRPVQDMGKILFVAGLILAAVGLLLWAGFGRGWLGRLPGDISYTKGNFSFFFPIVTCLLLSLLVTLVLWLFRK